jgi:tetratricopeptide (TPR) repeat protein
VPWKLFVVRCDFLRVVLLSSVVACVPTISKPRGEQHLAALARAETDQHAGRYDQAVAEYKAAAASAERRVDRDEALYRASRVLARQGKHQEAIAICDELAAATPPGRRTERAKLDAARYRLALGDDAKAEDELLKLVLEQPDSGAGKSALRVLLSRHVDGAASHEDALAWLRELESKVGDVQTHETLMNVEAELLLSLNQRAEAKKLLEQQVEKYPYPKGHRWDEALSRLADLALDDNDPKAAIAYLDKMVGALESSIMVGSYTRPLMPKSALRIARIYRDNLHDVDAALKAYARVRDKFPKSLVADDALQEEAELRFARGERDKACELLRELVKENEVGSARRRAEASVAEKCGS